MNLEAKEEQHFYMYKNVVILYDIKKNNINFYTNVYNLIN